jgi:hypothetical protein
MYSSTQPHTSYHWQIRAEPRRGGPGNKQQLGCEGGGGGSERGGGGILRNMLQLGLGGEGAVQNKNNIEKKNRATADLATEDNCVSADLAT